MRFLLDMGISVTVAAALRDLGHDAVHAQEIGLDRLTDAEVMQRALRDGRTVLTHDLDFANLLAASGAGLPSVVIFRLRNMRPERVLDRLRAVVAGSELELAGGVIAVVTESHIRLRHLPLEGS